MKRPNFPRIALALALALACLAPAPPASAAALNGDRLRLGTNSLLTAAQLRGIPASVTTTTTPGTGNCAAQFVFRDNQGRVITTPSTMLAYLSNSTGLTHATAITSLVLLTNGALTQLVTGQHAIVTTTAAGLLGVTLTGTAATRYLTFVLPNGKLLTSGELVIN
jgi:hypothetical protein